MARAQTRLQPHADQFLEAALEDQTFRLRVLSFRPRNIEQGPHASRDEILVVWSQFDIHAKAVSRDRDDCGASEMGSDKPDEAVRYAGSLISESNSVDWSTDTGRAARNLYI